MNEDFWKDSANWLLLFFMSVAVFFAGFLFGGGGRDDIAPRRPEVHVDAGTGQCLQVLPPEAGDCREMPDRHVRVWVAPVKK